MIDLIIGGARSGKSAYAEQLALVWQAEGPARKIIYVATAEAGDDEMARRIAHHRARRPRDWGLIEAPLALSCTLEKVSRRDTLLLVDCLTLWLTNLLQRETEQAGDDENALQASLSALADTLEKLPGPVILVSNEVGWGIVPMGELSRRFVDEQGRLNQRIGRVAHRVTLVAAGLPLVLKDTAALGR